jgi:uncharacterized membrane protein
VIPDVLAIISMVLGGAVAGVFLAVAVSVIPALWEMPASGYIEIHKVLGEGYHPIMPIICTAALGADAALVFLAPPDSSRVLFGAAALLVLGVQAVSHLGNVPINRHVHGVDPAALPANWTDPRREWRYWHWLRTVLALALTLTTAVAAVLM